MNLEIFFANSWKAQSHIGPDAILLVPSHNNWNNFGHRNHFYMWLAGERKAQSLNLAFLHEEAGSGRLINPDSLIKERFSSIVEDYLPASEFPDFFTMQHEMSNYRDLISKYGVEKGNQILGAINDLVVVRKSSVRPYWYNAAVASNEFNLSFLRNSETIFAFYNAASVLNGIEYEDLKVIDTEINIEFQLSGFKNEHKFKFGFDLEGIVPKQIAIIIGKNGVGKSRTLYQIADCALEGNDALRGKSGGRPSLNKIVAISTPGETRGTFPAPPDEARIRYERLLSERGFGSEDMGRSLPEILIQLAKVYDNQIGENSRWELFDELISRFCRISELVIGKQDGVSGNFVAIESLVRGGEQKTLEAMGQMDKDGALLRRISNVGIYPLSSGQVSFIRLAAQLSLTVENGTLILIDEPETHLHPNLVTDFVGMLNKILELTGSTAIVATHSAYLVREVPRSQVHVIQEEDGKIEVVTPRLKTFGADVGAISEFVFGDDIVNRLVVEVERRLRRNPQLRDVWQEKFKAELSPEAIMYLMEALENDGDSEGL
jgi:energy-coupling factor transporter ATP-binding protein EcfA2